jgi:hypothetical protein
MTTIARGFFTTAIVYGLLGMLLGLHMAITQDHGQRPTHAHIMVIGWVSFFLFGLFYLHFGTAVNGWFAALHFWIAQISLVCLMIGLWLVYSGQPQYEPIAAVSSIAYAASFGIFGFAAIPAVWARNQ